MIFKNRKCRLPLMLGICLMAAIACNHTAHAQTDNATLDRRVTHLEDYVATFQPTLVELSDNLNKSIEEYTKNLETSLQSYSHKLQVNLDERLNMIERKIVLLNPYSKSYQTIETNTGIFLIAVNRLEQVAGGVRLHVNVGNPNYADFRNFQLKFIWGSKWPGELVMSYNEWRASLNGAEYTFQGTIEKGKWNEVAVDLIPAENKSLGYLECEMYVDAVELSFQ